MGETLTVLPSQTVSLTDTRSALPAPGSVACSAVVVGHNDCEPLMMSENPRLKKAVAPPARFTVEGVKFVNEAPPPWTGMMGTLVPPAPSSCIAG